jgi:hypothetical protein
LSHRVAWWEIDKPQNKDYCREEKLTHGVEDSCIPK